MRNGRAAEMLSVLGSSAESIQIGRRGGGGGGSGIERPKIGKLKGPARTRLNGMGAVGTGAGTRDVPGASDKGGRGRGTRGGGSTGEEGDRGTQSSPKSSSTTGCAAPVAAGVLRRVRLEMRLEGGSALVGPAGIIMVE